MEEVGQVRVGSHLQPLRYPGESHRRFAMQTQAVLTFCGSPLSRRPRSCSFHPSLPNSCSVMRSALAASHGQMTQKPLDPGLAALQLVRRLLFGAWHFSVPIVPTRNFERPLFAFSQTHLLG